MAFIDDLQRHADQVKTRVPHIRGEEATKHALVVPLFQVLGYDVFDPREVQPEYIADFAKKKSNGQMEKVDYAIWKNGAPAIFVECKAVDAKLEDSDGQLARYFNATPSVKVAVLTNGLRFRVFTDLQQPNVMDATPWLDVDLLNLKPAEVDALRRFHKVDFATDQVIALAEEMVYYNALTTFLATQLRDPSETFVRYVASEIPSVGRVTQKVVERVTPILKKAIQSAIVEHVARSFSTAVEPETPPPVSVAASPAAKPELMVAAEGKAGVTTTADELSVWESIASWIREVKPNTALSFRDSKSYLTIHQSNVRKWFVRVNVQTAPYWLALRHIGPDEVRRLAPGMDLVEGGNLGDSRISLKAVADVPKLRAAIIAACEREATRKSDEGEPAADES